MVRGRTYQTSRYATAEEARDALVVLRALRVRELPTKEANDVSE